MEKLAPLLYAERAFGDGTIVKDLESLDLIEWACQDLVTESVFQGVLGPLRVRLAKSKPRNQPVAIGCLEDCLLRWDLNSAQQVGQIFANITAQYHSAIPWPRVARILPLTLSACHHSLLPL